MAAPATSERIKDVNERYHDAAAETYDSKWGIDFGPIGQDHGDTGQHAPIIGVTDPDTGHIGDEVLVSHRKSRRSLAAVALDPQA